MKRDMELIRLLLLQVEEGKPPAALESYSEEKTVYNSALLIEKGLVKGAIRKNRIGIPVGTKSISLTWEGHDFLDAARNEKIWKKATAFLKSKGLEASIDLMKQLLVQFTKSELGIS